MTCWDGSIPENIEDVCPPQPNVKSIYVSDQSLGKFEGHFVLGVGPKEKRSTSIELKRLNFGDLEIFFASYTGIVKYKYVQEYDLTEWQGSKLGQCLQPPIGKDCLYQLPTDWMDLLINPVKVTGFRGSENHDTQIATLEINAQQGLASSCIISAIIEHFEISDSTDIRTYC